MKLTELTGWIEDLYQIETNDPIEGGPQGIDNLHAKQLGARTRYLKSLLEVMAPLDTSEQASIYAAVKFSLEQGYLANLGLADLRQVSQQQGEFTIKNRGIVNGCLASKSVTATRNLSLAAGTVFAFGRRYEVAAQSNAASVPVNPGSGSASVEAYLLADSSGVWILAVTAIGQAMPSSAIKLYKITIPAGSTDATDPNLAAVSLIDVRRLEPEFPQLLNSPASESVVLKTLQSADYFLDFDIASAVGAPCLPSNVIKSSRATNGFTVMLASAADDVVIRWRLSQLSN